MKKKTLSLFLVLVMCLSLMPAGVFAQDTVTVQEQTETVSDTEHYHPICGKDTCDDHDGVQWTGISSLSEITAAGNYYLKNDIEISSAWTPVDGVNLCLNQKSITTSENNQESSVINLTNGVSFTLTDCSNYLYNGIKHINSQYGRGVIVGAGTTFTMYGGNIMDNFISMYNTSNAGAGVYVNGGTFNMYGGRINENTACKGGGIGIDNEGVFNMYGGTVSDNRANNSGAGVFIGNNGSGTFNMYGGQIKKNTAYLTMGQVGEGAGVFVNNSECIFNMYDGEITENNAYGTGSVCVNGGTFNMSGGKITGNTGTWSSPAAPPNGYGVYVKAAGTFTVDGNVNITGNTGGQDAAAGNVYLDENATITIGKDLDADSRIGVTLSTDISKDNYPVKFATGATGSELDYTKIFTADATNKGYSISRDEAENVLYFNRHDHIWKYTADNEAKTITATCIAEGCMFENGNGGTVTFSAPLYKTYRDSESEAATYIKSENASEDLPAPGLEYYKRGETTALKAAPVDAGDYTVKGTFGDASVTIDYTIAPRIVTNLTTYYIEGPRTYNGSRQTCPEFFLMADGMFMLEQETDYTVTGNTATDAGEYKLNITLCGNYANQTGQAAEASWEIMPLAATIEWDGYENRTYGDGKTVTAAVSNKIGEDDVTVVVSGGDETEVGDHTASAAGLSGDKAKNYTLEGCENTTQDYTIGKVAAKVTKAPEAKAITYNGTEQELISAGAAEGGTMIYSTSENGTYSKEIPTATDAGNYEVWYKVEGDSNHSSTVPVKMENVSIAKRIVKLQGVTVKNKTYDGSEAAEISSKGSLENADANDDLTYTVDGTFADANAGNDKDVTLTVALTGSKAGNYELASDSQTTVKANITAKEVTVSGITAVSRVYEKGNNSVQLSADAVKVNGLIGSDKVSADVTGAVGAMADDKAGENKPVTVTGVKLGSDNVNYVLKEQPTDVTVNIGRASYTAKVSMSDYAYGSAVSVPKVDANPENGAVTYYYNTESSSQNGTEWKDITATALPIGTYYMYAVIAQTENYQSVTTAPAEFTVKGAAPEIKEWPTISGNVYVNDADLADDRLTGGSAAAEGSFAITDTVRNWSESGEKQLNVTFTPSDKNYSSVAQNITVKVIKRTVTSVAESAAITDKTFKTEQSALGLPTEIEITVEGSKKFTVPVSSWDGYDPETLDEQTITGTLDLSAVSAEVQQAANEVKASVKVTLQPVKLPAVSFESKEATYTGQPIKHEFGDITGIASVKYEYEGTGSTNYEKSESAPVHAGTYTVTATFTMENGYAQLAPVSALLTINKADGSVTAPTAVADLVYNGSAQTLINAAVSSAGEVQYKLGENGTYGTELPKAVDAGKYNVYYKVTGDADHNDIAESSIEATVSKAKLIITVNNKNAYVNDKAPELTAPELDRDYKVSGLIGEDTLTTVPALRYVDEEGNTIEPDMTKAGTIIIGAADADAGDNYAIVYESGTLTVSYHRSSGGSSSAVPKYDVSAPGGATGGSVKSDVSSAASGSTVTVTVTAEEGYKLDGLTVTDSKGNAIKVTDKGNGKYTFTMPSDKVEIKPVFTKEAAYVDNELPFSDVADGDYYYEAVKWAKDNGITGGVRDDLFGSDDACTRGHIVTFLWRNAGSPEPKSMSNFSDVAPNSYYAKAVAWAVENGITNGVGNNKFDPDAACTRAQSVSFLYRAMGSQVSSKAQFSDVPANSYYADAVAWAAAKDVTNGIGGGLFGSDHSCTRAQIVTFLYRAHQAQA